MTEVGSSPFNYNSPKPGRVIAFHKYKARNRNMKNPSEAFTPGILMRTSTKEGDKWVSSDETVASVNAVILFISPMRKLEGAKGKLVCGSHDGCAPSPNLKDPKCRKASVNDLVQILSKWKGYDEAKIKGTVGLLTNGGATLEMCGLKKKDGDIIPLCPMAMRDKDLGKPASCKPYIMAYCYDLDRKRNFTMELSGGSIRMRDDYLAPFHQFMKRANESGVPYFGYSVRLSSLEDGGFFLLNVDGDVQLDEETLADMNERALAASERHQKAATRLSREDYLAQKKEKEAKAAEPPSPPPSIPKPVIQNDSVSFEDDDIPF